jgi:hypothetical protein
MCGFFYCADTCDQPLDNRKKLHEYANLEISSTQKEPAIERAFLRPEFYPPALALSAGAFFLPQGKAMNEKLTSIDDFVPRTVFCERFGISLRAAEVMAHQGRGPKVTKLGRRAFYHVDDIASWLNEQRQKSSARFERKAA